VPDPCFWTPELPFLYRAHVELRRGGEVLDVTDREFGIRPLGSRGKRFYYEGRPWVLRGVQREHGSVSQLREFREADAAMFVDNPDEELCTVASQEGVLIVASVSGEAAIAPENIRRLARHAAVGFIVAGDELPAGFDPRSVARNVVFVYRIDSQRGEPLPCWASAVVCGVRLLTDYSLPTIAFRLENMPATIAQGRLLCDALQRDLAGLWDLAGYLV
jgi:hypothetical protein